MSHPIKNYFANVWQELKFGYGLFLLYSFSALWWLSFFHSYHEAVRLMNDLSASKALSHLPWLPLVLSLFTTHDFYLSFFEKMITAYIGGSTIFAAAIVLITLFKDWAYTLHFMNNFSSS